MHDLSRNLIQEITPKVKTSQRQTFFLLAVILIFTGVVSWMTIYMMAVLPGRKLYNGLICGFAESFASLFSGFMLRWITDT